MLLKDSCSHSPAPSSSAETAVPEVPGSYGEKLDGLTLEGGLEGQGLVGTLPEEGSAGECHCSFVSFAVFSFHLADLEQAGAKPVTLH